MLRPLIEDFLRQQPNIDLSKLAAPDAKMHELGIDSLGMVEMLFEIEDRYGFHVDDPARYAQMTLDELVADLEATIKAKHGGVIPATLDPAAKADA